MNYSPEAFIKAIQVVRANKEQVSSDLVARNQKNIFINRSLLENLAVSDISSVWKHLFGEIPARELNLWQNFANQYFHQGGFLYLLEAMTAVRLTEKFVIGKDMPIFFQLKSAEKTLYIDFDPENSRLSFKEEIFYTRLKDANEKCSFKKEEQNRYLFKGQLLHKLELDISADSVFKHVIQEVNFDSQLEKSVLDPLLQLFFPQKKLQSECNVYLESLHLKFDELDGLANTYASSEATCAYSGSSQLQRRKAVKKRKKPAINAKKHAIEGQGYLDLAYPQPELNVAMDNLSLFSVAHQASGFFSAENRHKKLSRATANQCTDAHLIDPIPGATGTTWGRFP